MSSLLIIAAFLGAAPFIGAGDFYSYTSTIGVLALILVYVGVGTADVLEAMHERHRLWSVTCALGPLLLLWVLYRSVYPLPAFPNTLWPYVAGVWVAASWAVMQWRPAVTRAPLPDYS